MAWPGMAWHGMGSARSILFVGYYAHHAHAVCGVRVHLSKETLFGFLVSHDGDAAAAADLRPSLYGVLTQ